MNESLFHIRLPATTANLGPGFDCLGLALGLWNEVEISLTGNRLIIDIEGEGKDFLPCNEGNLIYRSFRYFAEKYSRDLPKGLVIQCRNRIPVVSGLGSSSSAILAGLIAANHLLDIKASTMELLEAGYELEGHADNLAACLLGGFVIVGFSGQRIFTRKISFTPIHVTVAVPEISFSTREARYALPKNYSIEDVVHNISRTSLLVDAFSSGNFKSLRIAMEDKIHQPYRLKLIQGAEQAISEAIKTGADGAALSGAGPSIIAFHLKKNEKIKPALGKAFEDQGVPVRMLQLKTTKLGAFIS